MWAGPEFQFDGVRKEFMSSAGRSFVAVDDISLTIEPATFTCVSRTRCASNGEKHVAEHGGRVDEADSGNGLLLAANTPCWGVNTDVGYLTQHNNLLPWRTVERNVALALEIRGVKRAEHHQRVQSMLTTVGLSGFERHYITQLSGGMQKRAAIAKTLIYDPTTLLMDEPFGALDAQLRLTLQRELLDMLGGGLVPR